MLIGKEAPAFTAEACLQDNSFEKISLADYKGKYVVLFFWPADFTFVCASETIDFHKFAEEFTNRNTVVLGCSGDSAFVHKAWKNTEKKKGGLGTPIGYPMIADIHKDLAKKYDVYLENEGMCVRGVFIIDPDGIVRSEMKNDLPLGRNVEEVMRVLDSLIYTRENGAVCPSGWKPGKPAMKPTTEGVAEYLTKYT